MLGQQVAKLHKRNNSNTTNHPDLKSNANLGILALGICALVIIGLVGYIIKSKWHRHFITSKYPQVAYTHCSDKPLNRPHRHAINKLGIKFISPDDLINLAQQSDSNPRTIIYIPCSYNNSDWDIQQFFKTHAPITQSLKANNHVMWIIAAVLGCNKLCSKNGLWSVLETTYGRKDATNITPESWVIPTQSTMIHQAVKSPGTKTQMALIFKKNIQGKQGLLLTNSPDEIRRLTNQTNTNTNTKTPFGNTDKYSVAQRYLAQPYIIHGRKLNIRLYILVVVIGSRAVWWLYRAGKCIYTNRQYAPLPQDTTIRSGASEDMPLLEQHFTSLNLDSELVYKKEQCPETLYELQEYMSGRGDDWQPIWEKIQLGLGKVAKAYEGKLTAPDISACAYQIFGADYIISADPQTGTPNNPYLLEFNKGPEMKYKSPGDPEMKSGLQVAILELVLGKTTADKWIQINSKDKSKDRIRLIKK